MKTFLIPRAFILVLTLFVCSQLSFTQTQQPLTLDDYAQWNRITNTAIAPNGEWMTYAYKPNDGDATLHIRNINGDTLRTVLNGKQVSFSGNSQWLSYLVDPDEETAEKLKKSKKPVLSDLHLVNLGSNELAVINGIKDFKFSNSSKFIAIHKNPKDKKAKFKGSDILLKNLEDNSSVNIGNVSSFAFNEDGSLFSYIVDAEDDNGNGIYLIDLSNLRTWPLHTGSFSYSQLSWNEKGNQIAALFGSKKDNHIERDNSLFWVTNLAEGMSSLGSKETYVPQSDSNFPKNMVLSEYGSLTWNKAGTQIFNGIKAQQEKLKKEDSLKANVDVWHWKDERVQSTQIVQANRDKRSTFNSVLNLDSKTFIQLENDHTPTVRNSESSHWAVARVDTLYRKDVNLPGGYTDLYSMNTETGEKELIAEKIYHSLGMSPDGNWALFSKEGVVMAFNFEKKRLKNLTDRTGISFTNEDFDRPVEKPTFGIAGWSNDGKSVILNHKYDLWSISLNSDKAENMTQGIGENSKIRFRLVQLDPEAKSFDMGKPLLLSAYGDKTKKSGYYSLKTGKTPVPLRFEDKMLGRLTKAKNADKIIYTEQTFVEFPDYWVSDLAFKNTKKITDANPQQSNYKWGSRVLIDFTDSRGHQLQATLALPADYDSSKTYPMIIYFYEKLSQRHHQYSMPTYDDRPHMSTYASNGYLVLMPDIVYDEGLPGSSALDDVTSAAKEVIKLGYADPEKIGLQGHSWGGYESSFILTQTDMFATVLTGAPLTNLISMYTIAYKRTGNLNGPILEWSQGRMGVSPWDNMELYRSQSPIHHAKNIETPFLILHGTSDGAVDWNQGLEFYSTARRLGKEVILLSYPDEPHHLRKEANQKDFQIRMKQYFDHYLKGTEAPLWMTDGVPHLKKNRISPEVFKESNED